MYKVHDISFQTLKELHDFYVPSTIITESTYNEEDKLYTVTITGHAILKINDHNLTFDLGGKLYTINQSDYSYIVIM